MIIRPIYIYNGEGGMIQTPVKLPLIEERQMRRLIPDTGKLLTNGTITSACIDVEINDIANWTEIDENINETQPEV